MSRMDRHRPRRVRELYGVAARAALLWAVATFAVIGTFAGFDYWQTRGVPTEQATVTAVRASTERVACGRQLSVVTDGETVSLISRRPPQGLPATFSVTTCPDAYETGEVVPVRRTGVGENDDDIHLDPVESLAMASAYAAIAATCVLVGAWVAVVVSLVWRERRWKRRHPA